MAATAKQVAHYQSMLAELLAAEPVAPAFKAGVRMGRPILTEAQREKSDEFAEDARRDAAMERLTGTDLL